jgi:hypothetical protein
MFRVRQQSVCIAEYKRLRCESDNEAADGKFPNAVSSVRVVVALYIQFVVAVEDLVGAGYVVEVVAV